ncbi:hypothetical protein YC2023_018531 [Brassica napus]
MLPTIPRKFRWNPDGNGSFLGISSEFFRSPNGSLTAIIYPRIFVGTTCIKNSHQHARGKGDSRRGDESLNDVQKTLSVAHPRGSREQPGQWLTQAGAESSYNESSNDAYKERNPRNMSESISVDDQQQEWTNHVLLNSCLWTNLGQRSHEIMSSHTLQAQGRRSTVALPEKIKAHRECHPGAKSKDIAPYARGTKVIGKADRGARQHPVTSMFQKGLPQNLRNQFHKLRVSKGRSPQTSMFQEDKGLSVQVQVVRIFTYIPEPPGLRRISP